MIECAEGETVFAGQEENADRLIYQSAECGPARCLPLFEEDEQAQYGLLERSCSCGGADCFEKTPFDPSLYAQERIQPCIEFQSFNERFRTIA